MQPANKRMKLAKPGFQSSSSPCPGVLPGFAAYAQGVSVQDSRPVGWGIRPRAGRAVFWDCGKQRIASASAFSFPQGVSAGFGSPGAGGWPGRLHESLAQGSWACGAIAPDAVSCAQGGWSVHELSSLKCDI